MFLLLVTCKDMEKELDSQLLQGELQGRRATAFSCLEMMYVGNNKIPINVYRGPVNIQKAFRRITSRDLEGKFPIKAKRKIT